MGRLMKGIHPEMTEKKEGGLKLYFLRWCRLYLLFAVVVFLLGFFGMVLFSIVDNKLSPFTIAFGVADFLAFKALRYIEKKISEYE